MTKVGYRLDDGKIVCNRCGDLHPDIRLCLFDNDVGKSDACSICSSQLSWPKLSIRPSSKFPERIVGIPIIYIE